jgi:hypothetical protein
MNNIEQISYIRRYAAERGLSLEIAAPVWIGNYGRAFRYMINLRTKVSNGLYSITLN